MRRDPYDLPPSGYDRSENRGWIKPARTPHAAKLKQLQQQNDELACKLLNLSERLEQLELSK